jgi:hypothetical protein
VGFLITHDDLFGLEGLYLYTNVIDNGEGNNADPDMMANALYVDVVSDCETYCPSCVDWDWAGYFTSVNGNIQVD